MSRNRLHIVEYIVLVSIMFSMIAFGSDAMLPTFPQIGAELGVSDINHVQLVITVFVLGSGIGQLFTGPLSDALGRKPVILGGLVLYMAGSLLATMAQSLDMLLIARMVQGLGVSAPRTVAIAMTRDLYAGRMMSRVMSFSQVLFVLVPAVSPLIGQELAILFGWRSIFVAFILFALIGYLWLSVRQPETHPASKRRAMRAKIYLAGFVEVLTSRVAMTYTLVLAFAYGSLFGYLSSAQQIYVDTFGKGTDFPYYFAGIALISGLTGFTNGMLVVRFGMRLLTSISYVGMFVITSAAVLYLSLATYSEETAFTVFYLWSVLAFFVPGLTFGNLNALALQPMGHIAGMASAVMGAVSTFLGVLFAIPIGYAFDGTAMPLLIGSLICAGFSMILMLTGPKSAVPAGA